MSESFYERYWVKPAGRSFIIAGFLAIFSIVLAFYLALQNPTSTSLGFLYKELPLEETNWSLTIVILVLMQITFLGLVLALANFEELNGRIPGWGQIFFPMIITELLALFVTNVTTTGTVAGSEQDVGGLSNFNSQMTAVIGWGTLVLMIGWAFYFYYAAKED